MKCKLFLIFRHHRGIMGKFVDNYGWIVLIALSLLSIGMSVVSLWMGGFFTWLW